MRNILLIGAGKSSSSMIKYFLDNASKEEWTITVADVSEEQARNKIGNHPSAKAIAFNINNEAERKKIISNADIVISMLPASMHMPVAIECLAQKKNLVTASYVSNEMHAIDSAVKENGLIFLNECGLDPGLDHMSAMDAMDKIKSAGGKLTSFKSYTGGLVAPESNDNPWGYKFSWNPRNVILAGQGTACYIEEGKYKYIPYNRLFTQIEKISIDGLGEFDGYANRDSLSYRKLYHIDEIPTMIRGTLRQAGYCSAWNVFVKLGMTDDSYKFEGAENLSYKDIVEAFLPVNENMQNQNVEEKLAHFAGLPFDSRELEMVKWTGILYDVKPGLKDVSPAQILQFLLEQKWKLKATDQDMIVMQHQFGYIQDGKNIMHSSSLVVKGENSIYTAMAKTVGLPAAIAVKNILNGKITLRGVQVPVDRVIYEPVLKELKENGISFVEKVREQA